MPEFPTALVTGAGRGVGHDIADELLSDGYTVVLHSRTPQQSRDAAHALISRGADPARIQPVAADFTRLDEVIHLARRVADEHPVLTLLVNAAVSDATTDGVTADGNEIELQVNYLAPALLTRALEVPLRRAAGPRVVTLSTTPHPRGQDLEWDDIHRHRRYTTIAASNIALTMLATALAKAGAELDADATVVPMFGARRRCGATASRDWRSTTGHVR
ncbi:short-chain dehydrogenase/reductase SDR [Alloactinosynnema sp. L-07]|uniref:SDR family NAD(P)-dependent oxidoreductase n=1 Tax=Alloactinosynnema sp. L-07 TaxID=1653480 RepID=UPI00065EF761|nr:SDR family NAD(P)-dependent oxidoreductase [Alloactinosynnema sp. L-07]CRK57869.1 short-chain dehydrogenase/reductase SDR [Alloactinosynnema sp. L-07]